MSQRMTRGGVDAVIRQVLGIWIFAPSSRDLLPAAVKRLGWNNQVPAGDEFSRTPGTAADVRRRARAVFPELFEVDSHLSRARARSFPPFLCSRRLAKRETKKNHLALYMRCEASPSWTRLEKASAV
jgi:hypothetical protein